MSFPQATPTSIIGEFIETLHKAVPDPEDVAVILIGSVARSAATSRSDLDLLVISEDSINVQRTANQLHVQLMTQEQLRQRLREGDDFAAWCVRYGVPVQAAPVWNRIATSLEATNWPDWRPKIDHAARRLLLADELLASGDMEAAAEEITYAISHVGRALLLKRDVFPLSRPEMIRQLSDEGFPELAGLLLSLSLESEVENTTRRGIRYVKKLLVHLDRERFQAYLRSRQTVRKHKASRKAAERLALAG